VRKLRSLSAAFGGEPTLLHMCGGFDLPFLRLGRRGDLALLPPVRGNRCDNGDEDHADETEDRRRLARLRRACRRGAGDDDESADLDSRACGRVGRRRSVLIDRRHGRTVSDVPDAGSHGLNDFVIRLASGLPRARTNLGTVG
jgi:hypothetical protein